MNWNGQTGTLGGIWCLTRRACCRRWSPGPFPDWPQWEMGAQGKLTGPVDPQGRRDAVSNVAELLNVAQWCDRHTASEKCLTPSLPFADGR